MVLIVRLFSKSLFFDCRVIVVKIFSVMCYLVIVYFISLVRNPKTFRSWLCQLADQIVSYQ